MLPLTPYYSNVTLTGFLPGHFAFDMRHYTQERSFLTLKDKILLKAENIVFISKSFRERSSLKGGSEKINKEKLN